ncbi:hypothetical protein KCU92_g5637, partial [Aureobasidium melanogenum]
MDLQAKPVEFLRLPPEIRNQIYHHVLSEPQGLSLNSLRRPALLATSRQIQQEASPILFASNHSRFNLSRSHPGWDPNIIFGPSTGMFLRNMQAYMTHIVRIDVHATIHFIFGTRFFPTFRIEVKCGRVHIKLDVTDSRRYARSLCLPILQALHEQIELIAGLSAGNTNLSNVRFAFVVPKLTAGLFLSMAAPAVQSSSKWRTTPPHIRYKSTVKTTTDTRPSNSRFLDLPGEIRNVIYNLVLEETICDYVLNLHDFRIPIPKLALVCKQIFREVVGVQFTKDDSEFYWQGHDSGGDLDFSVTQTPMLSADTQRWAERCAMLGAPLNFKHLVFYAPACHGTEPSASRRTWCIHVENGTARVEFPTASTERECAEIWKNNMSKELSEIMHQHKTKSLGIPELEAFRFLLGRFNLHEHFRGKSLHPQALMSNDPDMVRLKATYLGCHLETHPWKYYTESSRLGMHET